MGKEKEKGNVFPPPTTGLLDKQQGAAASGVAAANGSAAACAQCGVRSAELKNCARCLQVAYCSKE